MENLLKRKVYKGRAKDYTRDAKYFDYYYINFMNKSYTLPLNGWEEMYTSLKLKNNCVKIDSTIIKLVF